MCTIYAWFTFTAVRSWYAHLLVCILIASAFGILAAWLEYNILLVMCLSSSATFILFCVREMADELRYRREGTYNKRHWADRVKASTDRGGDTLGPFAVFVVLWAHFLVQLASRYM